MSDWSGKSAPVVSRVATSSASRSMRNPLRDLWSAVRVLVKDRHDVLAYTGLSTFTAGIAVEFGHGWALTAFGAVVLLFAWKGI